MVAVPSAGRTAASTQSPTAGKSPRDAAACRRRPARPARQSSSPPEIRYCSRASQMTRAGVDAARSPSVTCCAKNEVHPRASSACTVVSSRGRVSAHLTVEIGVGIGEKKERPGGQRSTCETDERLNPGTRPPAVDNHRQLLVRDSTPFELSRVPHRQERGQQGRPPRRQQRRRERHSGNNRARIEKRSRPDVPYLEHTAKIERAEG